MASILVMEDDDQFRQMLRVMLETSGYQVTDAADGEAGLSLYRKAPTDLIIVDIFMPWKEGLETIKELREDFPDVKIIAISGGGKGGHFDYLDRAKFFGAQKSLAKPFRKHELLEAVGELLT